MIRVTKKDIIKIKKGESRSFLLPSGAAMNAVRAMVYYVNRTSLPEGVTRYRVNSNYDDLISTITGT